MLAIIGDFMLVYFICLAPLGSRLAAWWRTWDRDVDVALRAKGL